VLVVAFSFVGAFVFALALTFFGVTFIVVIIFLACFVATFSSLPQTGLRYNPSRTTTLHAAVDLSWKVWELPPKKTRKSNAIAFSFLVAPARVTAALCFLVTNILLLLWCVPKYILVCVCVSVCV
jgi:uncharacterized protein with PQ loop repeat